MGKILSIIGLVVVIIIVFSVVASCGDTPSYDISNVNYDPELKIISWDDNSEADEWILTINGEEYEVQSRQYTFDAEDSDFSLSIEGLHKGQGDEENPKWTGRFVYLPAPTDLAIKDGVLSWKAGASYDVEVYNHGNLINTVQAGENKFQLPAGNFSIYLKPVSQSSYETRYFTRVSETVSGVCLSSPNTITYENGVFEWSAVEGADAYDLVINGQKFTSTTNKFPYSADEEDINISVSATSNEENAYSAVPLEKTCYYLTPVSNFSFNENGDLVWGKVNNATEYTIIVNGVEQDTLSSEVYSNIHLDTPYTVSVIPNVAGGISYSGEPISFSFEKLDVVRNVKFSSETSTITWDTHARAKSYEVIVNNEKFTTDESKYVITNAKQDIAISVWAVGNGENSRSYAADTVNYTYIAPVSGLTVKNGALTWNASEKAKSYKLSFSSGSIETVTDTTYTNIRSGTQYIVKVLPLGENENYFSYWSGEFTFQVLPTPTLNFNNGIVTWNGTSIAGGYTVSVTKPGASTSIEENLSANTYSYTDSYSTAGKYVVAVRANPSPNSANLYESAFSTPMSITRLAPTTGHEIISDLEKYSDGVQMRFDRVSDAAGYVIYVNGTKTTEVSNPEAVLDLLSKSDSDNEQEFTIDIISKGAVSSNAVTLDSLEKYSFNVTRLATPQNLSIEGKTVSWSAVGKATKYIVTLDSKKLITTTNRYELTDITEGEHKISVQAVGDATTTVASRYAPVQTITKLSTPKNVQLVNNSGATVLTWEPVAKAKAYRIKLGTQEIPCSECVFNIESSYLNSISEGTGMQLSVWAVNGTAGHVDSEPSETKSISRFVRPSNLAASGNSITWNDSTVDGIKATSYKLYIDNSADSEPEQVFDVHGASYSTADFAPGEYRVRVVAVGDNAKTLDSPATEITITKLGKVSEVRVASDNKSYEWDAISGAQKYRITVNGEEFFTSYLTFTPNFSTASNYTITITAISENDNVISGDTYTFEQVVSALSAPTYVDASATELGNYGFKIEQNGNSYTITAATFDNVDVQYVYIVGGVTQGPKGNIHTATLQTPNWDYDVQVQFIANSFGNDGIFYISSQLSEIQKIRYS